MVWCALGGLVGCGGSGSGGSGSGEEPDFGPDFGEPVAVTAVVPGVVPAGTVPAVQCWALDGEDRRAPVPEGFEEVDLEPAGAFSENASGEAIAAEAGDAAARCRVPSLGLVQDEPSPFQIVPGPVYRTEATVDRDRIVAGEPVHASCEVFDAWDNPIDDLEVRLAVDPATAGTDVEDLSAWVRQAGDYTALCDVPGAEELEGAPFTVDPDLPSDLLVAREPEKLIYGEHEVVALETQALDRFGNEVPAAMVQLGSLTGGALLGPEEGTILLGSCSEPPCTQGVTATLTGSTYQDQPVSVTVQFTLRGQGPRIQCIGPRDASMVDWPPGGTRLFAGRVPGSPTSVEVNGEEVDVDENGRFETDVPARFGMNFVDVEAVDFDGNVNSRACTFLLADEWATEHGFFNDSVGLTLHPDTVDDDDRADLDSLADAMDRLINSEGLHEALENVLLEMNPLVDWRDCFVACVSARAYYEEGNLDMGGPHLVEMRLVDGGVRVRLGVRDVHLRLELEGTCSGFITVDMPWLYVDATLNLRAGGGVPSVSTRRVDSVSAPFFDVDIHPRGACIILSPLVSIIEGIFWDEGDWLEGMARDFLEQGASPMLGDVLGSLRSGMGTSFDVPRLGGGTLPLDLAFRVSSVDADPDRLLMGGGLQVKPGSWTRGRSSRGVALPPGPILREVPVSSSQQAAVTVHVGLINQALHALWRGGYFDLDVADLVPEGLELPEGVEATLRMRLPPVAHLRDDGRLELHVGGLAARVAIPGVEELPELEEGIEVAFGMVASGEILFDPSGPHVGIGPLEAHEVSVSVPTLDNVPPEGRQAAEDLLVDALQLALDHAVNDALPSFPIPHFTFGPSLEPFDLSGTLRLTDPELEPSAPHYLFRSGFGHEP
ncbi:MAG: hypothetical protein ACODAU_03690 [Myxococcota bacterium]